MSSFENGVEEASVSTHHFICPITLEVMKDPVICSDGITYERSAITEWLKTHNTSPKTNQVLPNKTLIPNLTLKAVTDEIEHKPPNGNRALKDTINEMKREHPNWETMDNKIDAKRRKLDASPTAITIYIKSLMGTTTEIKVDTKDSVRKLKAKFSELVHIPPDQMRLIFEGQQLENRKTLAEYNVCDHCTLYLVLLLSGC